MQRLIRAFFYSLDGLKDSFLTEPAFRQEVLLAVVAIPLACFLDVTMLERALLIGSILLIFIAELANTAIEACIDRISEEKHPLSKKAKDAGSALVLLALINAGLLWIGVLWA